MISDIEPRPCPHLVRFVSEYIKSPVVAECLIADGIHEDDDVVLRCLLCEDEALTFVQFSAEQMRQARESQRRMEMAS